MTLLTFSENRRDLHGANEVDFPEHRNEEMIIDPVVGGDNDDDEQIIPINDDDSSNSESSDDIIVDDDESDEGGESISDTSDAAEDSDDDNDDRGNDRALDDMFYRRPLYHGAPLRVEESLLLILSLALKHNLSDSCVADVISLITYHCLPQRLQKLSLYYYKKFFRFTRAKPIKKYYCSNCFGSLADGNAICRICRVTDGVSYFLQFPIAPQVQQMLNRPSFFNSLQYRFHRRIDNDRIRDIYDGNIYKEYFDNGGFLSNPNNISFTWSTDGVPVFKSSKVSMWPFYLRINELPPEKRNRRENIILAGLWFGSRKPAANIFVDSFAPELKVMSDGNQKFNIAGRAITVIAKVLTGVCDLPAKSLFLNMTQFNGDYGCHECEHSGETFPIKNNRGDSISTVHIYRYKANQLIRTLEQTMRHAATAFQNELATFGIKDPSSLRKIMADYVTRTAIDPMHAVFEGITKKLLSLWFDPAYSNENFSLRQVEEVINNRISSIKPPKFIHRLPRDVSQFGHWKASELKHWFYFWSPVLLRGIMLPNLYNHYMKLVKAIALLDQDEILKEEVETAKLLLDGFVRDFEGLYGKRHCNMNLHLLLHLADNVLKFGPLWVHSCFSFENLNGQLLKLISGTTKNIDTQVTNSHWQFLEFFNHLTNLREPFYSFAIRKKTQVKILEKFDNFCSVGVYKQCHQTRLYQAAARYYFDVEDVIIRKYERLLKNSLLYVAESYERCVKSNSSYVVAKYNGQMIFGSIVFFIKVLRNDCPCIINHCTCIGLHFAVIKEVLVDNDYWDINITPKYVYKCSITNNIKLMPVEYLSSVCAYQEIIFEDDNGQIRTDFHSSTNKFTRI